MFGSGWEEIVDNERGGLTGPLPDGAKVERLHLPFYEAFSLMRLEAPLIVTYYLVNEDDAFWLNGTADRIHQVNGVAPVKITEENVVDYLKFYCYFVRGEEGPFLIVEPDDAVGTQVKAKSGVVIHPAMYLGRNEQGHVDCQAMVLYGGTIFQCRFEVHADGTVEMLDDDPLAKTGIFVEEPFALY